VNRVLRWVVGMGGMVLVGNFYVLMRYGYAIRSTNLFITRGLVFYPLAWLNLLAGIAMFAVLFRDRGRGPR
jgi:hypothetical protein